jgi:membrane fusion protein, heavy metal efflux system
MTPFTPYTRARSLRVSSMAALLLALATGGLTGCSKNDANAAEVKPAEHADDGGLKLSAEEAQRAGIKLEAVSPQAIADTVTVTATIRADQDRLARISPRVEGRLVSVQAKLGDTVKAGQSLAALDSLAIGEAATAWSQAQSDHRVAEADFKRAEGLNAEEIIPKKDYLRAQSEHEKAAAALRAAEDRLRLLGATPARGADRPASTFQVTAPFAGTVIEKSAITGQLASPSDALFVVADLSRLWIVADLTEAALARVRPGATATVTVEAYPGERFTGRVTYISPVLDKDRRTVPARIEVENQDGRLKPEMFASAIITSSANTKQPTPSLTVPDEAIVLMQGLPTVFVFEKGKDEYEQRPIQTGDKLGGRTVVKSGLEAGEQVVATGAYALKARLLKSQIGDEH